MNNNLAKVALELIEELVIVLSSHGKVTWMNRAALHWHDWTLSDVIDQPFLSLLKKTSWPSPFPQNTTFPLQDNNLSKKYETYIEATNQTIVWKLTSYTFTTKEKGTLLIGKDISDIRQAENKIFELDSIMAQTPGNLYWFDKNNVYLGCNEESAKVLGIPREAAVGKDIKSLLLNLKNCDEKVAEMLIQQGKKVIQTGKPLLNVEEPPFSESKRYYIASKVPLRDKRGCIYGVLGISVDITKQKELESKLLIEKEKAETASQSKSEFIANMSHDIRTPITGMLAMQEKTLYEVEKTQAALKAVHLDPKVLLEQLMQTTKQTQQLLMSATYELMNLCNEILEVAQLEAGKTLNHTEVFHLKKRLLHITKLFMPVAKDKGLSLSFTFDEAIPHSLQGCRLYLDRILLNLIGNALKFTKKGWVVIRAKLVKNKNQLSYTSNDTIFLTIEVEDSGIGIPKDKQRVIFEHFCRLTSSYSGIYKGAGLGLYTVNRYTQSMKGTVEVTSEVNKGSCFTLTLPFMIASKEAETQEQPTILTSNCSVNHLKNSLLSDQNAFAKSILSNNNKTITTDHKTTQVLVVEDNAMVAIGMKMQLKKLLCDIDIANNQKEAVSMAKNKLYDIIFMDIGLPDFSGVEATKAIRSLADKKHAKVPIIAITGHADQKEKNLNFLNAGMQAVLNKPARLSELKQAIKIYVSHYKKK